MQGQENSGMDSGSEVVITGWDVVCPLGVGKAAFGAALAAGASGVRQLPWLAASPFPVHIGGEVPDFDGKKFVQPRKAIKVMCREIQMGYAACVLAATDARIAAGTVAPDRLGVIFASEMLYPEVEELVESYRACLPDGQFEYADWGRKGLAKLYPLWLLKYLPNMVGCHIGIWLDARGPNNSIVNNEISSIGAVQEASDVIRRGMADVMFVGGIGSRLHMTPLIFRDPTPLSRRNADPAAASRPFDVDRDGLVNGEGAAALVLERRAHAEARGATIYATVLGSSSGYDHRWATESASIYRRVIRQTLAHSELAAADVGHVNAHGLSTRSADIAEAQAIRDELGDVPVTALKSYFGHLGAGSGLVELCGSLHAFQQNQIPPTLNCHQVDPACPVQVVRGQAAPVRQPVVLKLSQNSTGAVAALALRGPAS